MYLSRCMLSMAPEVGETPPSRVRVSFHVRQCPLADLSDLDALADSRTMPQSVANALSRAASALDADLRL